MVLWGATAKELRITLPRVKLTEQQLRGIYSERIELKLGMHAFTALFINPEITRNVTWLEHDLLRRDLNDFIDATKNAAEFALYRFAGSIPISGKHACFENKECTIIANWNGKSWVSEFIERPIPDGWSPSQRQAHLRKAAYQIHLSSENGHFMLSHTFPGPMIKWLVFNEAFVARGRSARTKCVFCISGEMYVMMDKFIRLNAIYPVGLVGYEEEKLPQGH
ncbi:hypothetical protein DSO57_1011576 [Entomophthora muscae]|uniref:Uncharacterized protein n=1 Tax=Entomophthora muscae TaxID=34485 RepID=A0ACC2SV24_9FUNG|nr:hypothetical protein DSO57_1011576 [Entomophthora muscae]